jgi:hypothetical protein
LENRSQDPPASVFIRLRHAAAFECHRVKDRLPNSPLDHVAPHDKLANGEFAVARFMVFPLR